MVSGISIHGVQRHLLLTKECPHFRFNVDDASNLWDIQAKSS